MTSRSRSRSWPVTCGARYARCSSGPRSCATAPSVVDELAVEGREPAGTRVQADAPGTTWSATARSRAPPGRAGRPASSWPAPSAGRRCSGLGQSGSTATGSATRPRSASATRRCRSQPCRRRSVRTGPRGPRRWRAGPAGRRGGRRSARARRRRRRARGPASHRRGARTSAVAVVEGDVRGRLRGTRAARPGGRARAGPWSPACRGRRTPARGRPRAGRGPGLPRRPRSARSAPRTAWRTSRSSPACRWPRAGRRRGCRSPPRRRSAPSRTTQAAAPGSPSSTCSPSRTCVKGAGHRSILTHRHNGAMSEPQSNAARIREINDSIRYTMWSVFRLADVLGERRRPGHRGRRGREAVRRARRGRRRRPGRLRRQRPARGRRPDGLVARRRLGGAAGGVPPVPAHGVRPAAGAGLVAGGAAPARGVQPEPRAGVPRRRGAEAARVRLPVRALLRVVPPRRRGAPHAARRARQDGARLPRRPGQHGRQLRARRLRVDPGLRGRRAATASST